MADKLIIKTENKNSGFYLDNYKELKDKLIELKNEKVINKSYVCLIKFNRKI